MKLDLSLGNWLNKPANYLITETSVAIETDPGTDFWQRSYYGFRNDNAPALLFSTSANFSLSAKVSFVYKKQFDQCGLIIYLDSDNWFKGVFVNDC